MNKFIRRHFTGFRVCFAAGAAAALFSVALPADEAETAAPGPAAPAPGQAEAGQKAEKESVPSTISADQTEMDMKKGIAILTGNVIVSDATMTLNCDTMTIAFSEQQRITKVEAVGHVVILEPANQRKATADMAIYDLEKGTVTLSGDPKLEMQDRKMYNAETITYDLKSEKVNTTGKRTVLEFKTAGGGMSLDMLGGEKKSEPAGKDKKNE